MYDELVFLATVLYFAVTISILACSDLHFGHLNPVELKDYYRSLNWFGVIIAALFFNILFILYAPFYWFYKLMTFKRKD